MRVYFTASIVGKKHYLHNYQKIIEYLKNHGCDVISDHIIQTSESQIRLESKQDRLAFHKKLEGWINSCDFVVAETSFPSISVGYEIAASLHRGKPVLILFTENHAPSLLIHHEDERLVCEMYTLETLPGIIEDFLNYVTGNSDSRFTFYITSSIASYLEGKSKKEKLPKSVYLRKLIEADMKTHER